MAPILKKRENGGLDSNRVFHHSESPALCRSDVAVWPLAKTFRERTLK